MSESVQLSENQAENMNRALGDVSVFASGNAGGNPLEAGVQPGTAEIAKITSIDALIDRWEPRYDDAKLAYVKFEAAINNAKASAAGYFAAQQAITERINDPGNQGAGPRGRRSGSGFVPAVGNTGQTWHWPKHGPSGCNVDDMDASLRKLELRTDICFRHLFVPGSAGSDTGTERRAQRIQGCQRNHQGSYRISL